MQPFETYEKNGTDPFDAPIPGESLTGDPNTPKPWEGPPAFTDVNDALQETFLNLTAGEAYVDLLDAMRDQVPVDMLTQTILFGGYMRGQWNTDLMLLMVEPLMYILIALAEHNGIYDYTVYDEEDDDMSDEEAAQLLNDDAKRMSSKATQTKAPLKVPEEVLPNSLLAQIQKTPVPQEQALLEPKGEM
jgi:hypothetical protein